MTLSALEGAKMQRPLAPRLAESSSIELGPIFSTSAILEIGHWLLQKIMHRER
jgi:hypothetical protein